MNALVLVCGVLLVMGTDPAKPSEDDLQAYQDAKSQAKRDPAAHVRLALWCEAHGLEAQRLKHLAIALLADPQNATARGLMGLVSYRGQWQKPADVAEKVRDDAALAEYNAKRDKTANTADAQWRLALWCEEKGLKAESIAHLSAVTRLDPTREAAWKRLGCKKHNGRWMSAEQIAAEKADIDAQKKADHHWKPLLEKWREWLGQKERRGQAELKLAELSDPRAVPSVWLIFGQGNAGDQVRAVQVLGQIEGPPASRALAILSVFGKSADARRRATETLMRRDPREFVGLLISFLRDPLKYEVRPVGGPGSPGVLFVEGERYNVQRLYNAPALPQQTMEMIAQRMNGVFIPMNQELQAVRGVATTGSERHVLGSNDNDLDVRMRLAEDRRNAVIAQNLAEAQRAAISAQQQLQNDVSAVELHNQSIQQSNENALATLKHFADTELGTDRKSWTAWWADRQGYAYEAPVETDKPTISQLVFSNYTPNYAGVHHACFGAGTPVRTLEGNRAIESLKVGDQILTQDPTTGALRFEPILAVFHNRPAPTLKVTIGAETIVVTGIHRFWRAGKGWAMARDLKPGDVVRTLSGLDKVTEVTANDVQPVFNLQVANGHSYFVGQQGALVHDNSLVEPVTNPFDAEPELAAAGVR